MANRSAYVLEVIPKRKEKYLFRGRIWVDAEDYALVRAEGNPAKNPSFWTKSTHFVQTYQKSGALWFAHSTQSVTNVRIFGAADVSIEYFDYAPKTHTPGQMCHVGKEIQAMKHMKRFLEATEIPANRTCSPGWLMPAVTQCLILAAGNGSRIASVSSEIFLNRLSRFTVCRYSNTS